MCDYKSRKEIQRPREIVEGWIRDVQKEMRKKYKVTFSFRPNGSVSRNMVIKKCNENYFDLDYQLEIQKAPEKLFKDCKQLKDDFRLTFDKYKPSGFSCCEDSTQALTTKNLNEHFGYDIIITSYIKNNYHILYNNKNKNGNNNKDYEWQPRADMKHYRERFELINGPEMWEYLRKEYKKKRHDHRNDQEPNKKASYQLFNEAVVDTLVHFKIDFPRN